MRILVLICISLFILSACTSQATVGGAVTEGEPTPIPTAIVPNVPIYQVERGDVTYQRRFSGRISPVVSMPLQFQIDGRILETYVTAGEDVTTDTVLAILDTGALAVELLAAEEELAIAQSLLDSAESQIKFDQAEALLNLDLAQLRLDYAIEQAGNPPSAADEFQIRERTIERDLTQITLNRLDSGVDPALRFDVIHAQQRVDSINVAISQAELIAPMDGRLTSITIGAGTQVVADESIGVIADLSKLEVTATLNPSELSELSEGMPVILQRFNLPDQVFDGTIAQLPQPYGTGTDDLVHVQFDTAPTLETFQVGDRLFFTVNIAEREDVLWLPASAIRRFSGRNFVVIQDGGIQQRIDVSLGLEGGDRVEILEGLEENQTVVGP